VSAGTDGQDGPTDAAGACVDGGTWARGLAAGLDADKALDEFDSYSFFDKEGSIIRTGASSVAFALLHALPATPSSQLQ
jgi:glycerate 2-kinase